MPARRIVFPLKLMLSIALFLGLLQFSGLLGDAIAFTHSLLLPSGLLDASPGKPNQENFSFDFALIDSNNATIEASSFKGKVVFINLWATWCGPCRAEMPGIEELYDQLKNDVAFVMLSLDKPGSEKKIKEYCLKNDYSFPVYVPASPLPKLLQVPSIPTTFVVNKNGAVVYQKVGTARYNTQRFKNFMQQLISE